MADIKFSNFGAKLIELSPVDAKIVKDILSENLKTYLLSKVPKAKRVFFAGKLKGVSIDIESVKGKSLSEIVKAFTVDNDAMSILYDLSESLKNSTVTVDNLLGFNLPLKDNPVLKESYYKSKTSAFGSIVKLSAAAINKLSVELTDIDDIDDQYLKKLVDERLITPAQKSGLQLVVDLSRLSGDNIQFISAFYNNTLTIENFIDYDSDLWKKLLIGKHIPIPSDEKSLDTYADHLVKSMEMSFPQTFFLNRIIYKKDFTAQLKTFDAVEKLSRLGKIEFSGAKILIDDVSWSGITEADKNGLLKQMEQLQDFSYIYRYVGITEVLANKDINIDAKKGIVKGRLDQLKAFYKKNGQVNFATVDFFNPEIKLDYSDVIEANKPLVKSQAMAFQRMLILGENTKTTQLLLAKGFSSSRDIIDTGEKDFVAIAGLELNEAKKVYSTALDNVTATSHFVQAIRDMQNGGFNSLAVNNLIPMVNDLRQIEGYSQLFGNQDFCDCEHCRSIFSPAAYFVDLMLFVEKNVTQKVFTGIHSDHTLKLQRRRHDLWTVPLTCQNTTTEIPYLDVVNNVLEQYIHSLPEVGNNDVYKVLSDSDISSNLPFNLPLEQLRTYLGHFELSLTDIYKLLNKPEPAQKQEMLGLSYKELSIITTPDPENAFKRFWNPTEMDKLTVSEFIRSAKIKRDELDELLNVQSIDVSEIYIIKKGSTEDIQKYEEIFKANSIGKRSLDLIWRFLRLREKTPWSIPEFDLVLTSMQGGLSSNLDEKNKVLALADVITVQNSLKLNVEELSSIIYEIREIALGPNNKSLYERLFNLKEIFGIDSATNKYNTKIDLNEVDYNKIIPFLIAGLSISEPELNLLLPVLGINGIPGSLSKDILSRLYRQSLLASKLKLSIENFAAAINLSFGGVEISSVSQMVQLIDNKRWIDGAPFNFQELDFIINGAENTANKFYIDLQKVQTLVNIILIDSTVPDVFKIDFINNNIQEQFKISGDQLTDDILKLASINNSFPSKADALNSAVIFFNELERKLFCLNKLKWVALDISFLSINYSTFGIADNQIWSLENVKSIVIYSNFLDNLSEETKTEIRQVLQTIALNISLSDKGINLFSTLWSYPSAMVKSVLHEFPFEDVKIDAVYQLHNLLSVCQTLGIQAESLNKLVKTDYLGLVEAKNIVYGAFAAKYPDEKVRMEKLEAYHDRINTLKRDALCEFIISKPGELKFKDRSDLYSFFLLDVEMSGCFRTSKLLAAISSVQLYIHRCLMNLEQSATSNLAVQAAMIPADEWEWRKNYRVWEANRKVFLYPENYIDPALRDTKTPLFKELEDELLQQKISMDTAQAAYKKYMAQFLELAHLRYAGAYYNYVENNPVMYVDVPVQATSLPNTMKMVSMNIGNSFTFRNPFIDKEKTIYYFFARTYLQPYQYYYRTFNQFKNLWGHWEKIDLPIEAEEISSIIHNGKLHIYWTEVQHQEVTNITEGKATSDKVIFKVTTKYSHLDVNGKWVSPQRLYLGSVISSYKDIFGRLNLTPELNKDNHDSIIDKYKLEVFRKPYISETSSLGELELRHIYTQGLHIHKITYKTKAGNRFPSFVFEVYDGDFRGVPKQSIKLNGDTWEIRLNSATEAIIYRSWKFVSLPVEVVFPFEPVIVTNYTQNIYKYMKEPNRSFYDANDALSYDALSTDNLGIEFFSAFMADGTYAHYVENGLHDFVNGNIILKQFKEGQAHLTFHGNNGLFEIKELSTILSDELNITLFEKGLQTFLSLQTQNTHNTAGQTFNFKGSYGAYYWELFFHIPFLIANHLNANQDFKGAKWWYERIFNPTSSERPIIGNPGEHYWQFREFRNLDIETLKEILSDESTIAVYKKNPFDPHAIAMLRIGAYQKAIVMKYIDNLLDWGDYLFSQDTQESIVEADMLYQLAQDILGKRPEKTGKCKTADEEDLTFERIMSSNNYGSEFLSNLENVYRGIRNRNDNDKVVFENSKYLSKLLENLGEPDATPNKYSDLANLSAAKYRTDLIKVPGISIDDPTISNIGQKPQIVKYSLIKELKYAPVSYTGKVYTDINNLQNGIKYNYEKVTPESDLTDQSNLAFCVPVNEELLQYWDRVEDRLFKIRNCMNISGIRRSLALFQPPINPMLLVRAKALGISLEEIKSTTDISILPNYRFVYMIEKAKQFTQNVQGFGAALLSALEKKDGEELTLLRSVHERNILRLTKEIKKRQLEEAQKQYNALEENLTNIENRIDYYQGLIDEGLTGWEVTEQVTKHVATIQRVSESGFLLHAGWTYLIAQLGSPFSLNYGGQEMGNSLEAYAQWQGSIASVLDSVSSSASLEASFQRRKEEWNFQLKTTQQELKQTTQQLLAADLRIKIAERDQEIHEKTIEQSNEVHEFFRDKFTNLGLYNYMATSLNRLYRLSYTMAMEMAKQADHCYKTETIDDTIFIENDNWQNDMAGLLSGERLMLQLQQMEKAFMDQNTRQQEITQSFSLFQINPAALLHLRQTGKFGDVSLPLNEVWIPEIAFDLLYPGQYQRVIKSVRISIPCIAGPYTNISAKLTLKNSLIRKRDMTIKSPFTTVIIETPVAKDTSITTSSSQNDGGVFELNFRDERYLPFEGAGAISKWQLELPNGIRSFDYNTISDVIFHISYTAKDDAKFRDVVENQMKANFLSAASQGLPRLLSLKNDFPDEFYRMKSDNSTFSVKNELKIDKMFFPYFASHFKIGFKDCAFYTKDGATLSEGIIKVLNLPDETIEDGWNLKLEYNPDNLKELDDVYILIYYTLFKKS